MNAATVFTQATAVSVPCRDGKYYEVDLAVRQEQFICVLERAE
jgi:hypothetical protein